MKIELFFNGFLDDFSLENITNEDIIRIEKKLILASKINTDINRNDIDNFLSILKEYPNELNYLINETNLVGFLNKQKFISKKINTIKEEDDIRKFIKFSNLYLSEIFKESINFYFKEKRYSELQVLSSYNIILSTELLELIHLKLLEKLAVAQNLFSTKIESNNLIEKLSFLQSKTFYLLLSTYSSYQIDDVINNLITISAEQINSGKFKKRDNFYLKFYKALHNYNCTDDNLYDVIQKNYLYAKERLNFLPSSNGGGNYWKYWLPFIILKVIYAFYLSNNK